MDFIERIFQISPDRDSGMLELVIVLLLVAIPVGITVAGMILKRGSLSIS
jgi:hypothetical protein